MVERDLVIKDRIDLRRDVRDDIRLPRFCSSGIFLRSYPISKPHGLTSSFIYENAISFGAIGANTPINEIHVFSTCLYCASSN